MLAREIQVNGIVQGVGFRPHVARTARDLGCSGWVLNNAHGVAIHVEHENAKQLDRFATELVDTAPAAAHILTLETQDVTVQGLDTFEIRTSEQDTTRSTLISPDLATCPDCLNELLDPNDRRFHYPFINCTNCGPRFTIIEDLPYDRPVTSMREFDMCDTCAYEYADDTNRRYHAQPNACFDCGPRLWWYEKSESKSIEFNDGELCVSSAQLTREESDKLIERAAEQLDAGAVLAIKGLGGWHLACDAANENAVASLRKRKHRPTKPLAIMVRDLDAARELAYIDEREAGILESPARPIVLLMRRDKSPLAANIADGLPEIGIMLPSTPVQHLLMYVCNSPLVMTSGNRSGEPIVASDADALDALGAIADGFLGNNRAIVARYDDSVVRITHDGNVQMVRRARGYAPVPLMVADEALRFAQDDKDMSSRAPLTSSRAQREISSLASTVDSLKSPTIFAAGPEQKSTFATLDHGRMYITQHLGDLERLGAWRAWEEARDRYERLFDTCPDVIACDLHPEYLASKWARKHAADNKIPLVEVQHHHAHIASVLGENALWESAIGIALDGTGYGTDGTIWGGEILIASRSNFDRFWHLPSFQLPGGTAAIFNPTRTAYALLRAYGELEDPFFNQLALDNPQFGHFLESLEERPFLDQMIDKNLNSPTCSSAGRLFDGVSSLLGLCSRPSYDGEAACLLEAAAHREAPIANSPDMICPPLTAWSFHDGLIMAIIEQTLRARDETGIKKVALSGGCMVNRIISERIEESLRDNGFDVYKNIELPPNDGCISYGQAIVAQACLEE